MRQYVAIRAIHGGVPTEVLDAGRSLADYGINAVFLGSGSITEERIRLSRAQSVGVFAEFNTMHEATSLDAHPDASPVESDGLRAPAPLR